MSTPLTFSMEAPKKFPNKRADHGGTVRERIEANPVVWLLRASGVSFVAGLTVMGIIMSGIISERGPRESAVAKNTAEPSRAPTLQLPVAPTEAKNLSLGSPTAAPTESGNMQMTVQEFVRRYLELDGRFAEQEAF